MRRRTRSGGHTEPMRCCCTPIAATLRTPLASGNFKRRTRSWANQAPGVKLIGCRTCWLTLPSRTAFPAQAPVRRAARDFPVRRSASTRTRFRTVSHSFPSRQQPTWFHLTHVTSVAPRARHCSASPTPSASHTPNNARKEEDNGEHPGTPPSGRPQMRRSLPFGPNSFGLQPEGSMNPRLRNSWSRSDKHVLHAWQMIMRTSDRSL
jgi:hypothetical protein